MLKQNTVSPFQQKDNRNFFAQKNRSRQLIAAQSKHETNKAAYLSRKEQRRVLARTLDPTSFLSGHGLALSH